MARETILYSPSKMVNSSFFVAGKLYMCGRNGNGQLGLGHTTTPVTSWTLVTTDMNPLYGACGTKHSAIIDYDGKLWTTGLNSSGQLGLNDTTQRDEFTDTGITGVSKVACGSAFTFILKTDGTLWCTGETINGSLGLGGAAPEYDEFQQVGSSTDWTDVSCGFSHTLAINDGKLYATGDASFGKLGLNDLVDRYVFTQEDNGYTDWTKCFANTGGQASHGIRADGKKYGTGYNNDDGQLGVGDTTDRKVFTQESNGWTSWTDICGGQYHSLGIAESGLVVCGTNTVGLFGVSTGDDAGSNAYITWDAGSYDAYDQITTGWENCYVCNGTNIYVAGRNSDYGQLGLGSQDDAATGPELSVSSQYLKLLEAGEYHVGYIAAPNTNVY